MARVPHSSFVVDAARCALDVIEVLEVDAAGCAPSRKTVVADEEVVR